MSVRVLITGFEPFGGDTANASGEAVLRLARRLDEPDLELVHAVIQVSAHVRGRQVERRGVAGVVPTDDLQQQRRIGDGGGERADLVE